MPVREDAGTGGGRGDGWGHPGKQNPMPWYLQLTFLSVCLTLIHSESVLRGFLGREDDRIAKPTAQSGQAEREGVMVT